MLAPILCALTLASQTSYVIKAARLYDGRSKQLVTPGLVVVEGTKISRIGGTAAVPGAVEIELGDATLLPGLIDVHVHIDHERSDDFRDDRLGGLQKSVPERTLEAAAFAKKTLLAGFTTVRNLGSRHHVDVGLRNAIDRGLTIGPRILASTSGIGATGGHCDITGFRAGALADDKGEGVADGPYEARAKVRRAVKYGAEVIKICATGGVLSQGDEVGAVQFTEEEIAAVVDEAHALGKKVAAHAHGALGALRAARAGVDSIEHGTLMDDAGFQHLAKKGIYLVPTPLNQKIYEEQFARGAKFHPEVARKIEELRTKRRLSVERALKLGVPIAFGTDAGVIPHGRNAEQFAILVEYGMKPLDAIRAATSNAAELIGRKDLGVLEAGKMADLVAVPGDPIADIRNLEKVRFVMKAGVVYKQ